jgi:hypothetical protein
MTYKKIFFLLFLIASSTLIHGQKREMTIEDLATWKFIESPALSPNGTWVSYEVHAEQGDPAIHLYNTTSGTEYYWPNASDLKVSRSEAWAAFKTSAPKEVVKDLKRKKVKEDKLPADTLVILDLASGTTYKTPGVKEIYLPDSLPNLLLYTTTAPFTPTDSLKKDPAKKRDKKNGFHLIIRDVAQSSEDTIFYVTDWEKPESGYRISTITTERDSTDLPRLSTIDLRTMETDTLYEGKGKVHQVGLSEDGSQVAYILDADSSKAYERNFELHLWNGDDDATLLQKDGLSTFNLPDDMEVHPLVDPEFSDNSQRLFVTLRYPPLVKDTLVLDEEFVDVEIWDTRDGYIYPQQEKRLDQTKKEGLLHVIDLETSDLRLIGTPKYPHVIRSKNKDARYALIYHNEKYLPNITWKGHDYKDLRGVDISTGESWAIADSIHGYPSLSPDGLFAYWYSYPDSAWMGYDMQNRQLMTWADNTIGAFYDETHDTPNYPGAYGLFGFSEDESTAYLYDRYDIWEVPTSGGSPKRITSGRTSKVRSRWLDLDKTNDHIDISQPQLIHNFSEEDISSGYAILNFSNGESRHLGMEDRQFGSKPLKAEKGSALVYTKEDIRTYPDLLLTSWPEMGEAKQITNVNPQAEDFKWGKGKIVQWEWNDKEYKGMLFFPDDWGPFDKYPMIVNFYEKSSDRLHRHRRPYLHRSTINYAYYLSKGYVIFNPDIKYTTGNPGKDATDIVLSGVEHVKSKYRIDEKRIGIQGHSWGGYQIAHILTKTDIFACAESGAPVVNMTSAYGGIRWGSGMSRMFQYERTQSRLGVTLWEDRETYLRNSPLFELDKVTTPVLILHNDEDGAVPWYQGIEYYMGLRRLGKPAWMLNYRGEPHWPVKFQNRKDFQTRMSQFFDHYLLGKPAPEWMTDGVPAHERGLKTGY